MRVNLFWFRHPYNILFYTHPWTGHADNNNLFIGGFSIDGVVVVIVGEANRKMKIC